MLEAFAQKGGRVVPWIALAALACGGTGGGQNPADTRPCVFNKALNGAAGYADNTVSLLEPRKCPYTVPSAGALTPFFAHFDALGQYDTGGTALQVVIRDRSGTVRYSDYPGEYTANTPGNGSRRRATVQGLYPGGHGGAPVKDSASLFFSVAGFGVGEMYLLFPGNVTSNASDVVLGTDAPMEGNTYTWRVYPARDTVSYLYQWRLDGVDIQGANGATYTWTPSPGQVGSHELSVYIQMSDLSGYTRSRSVYVAGNCGGTPCW